MIKAEWGTKRTCPKCGVRFYDLTKDEPVECIECGNQWTPEPVLKSKQPMPFEEIEKKKDDSDLADDDLDIDVDGLVTLCEPFIGAQNPNLDILPSHIDLVGAELEMINLPNREYLLEKAIAKIKDDYDFILIDCSPSLGLITINALVAADSVMIPVQCEYFALEGLSKLLNTIKIVQARLKPNLEIEGMVLTMYDTRLRLANQVVDEVKTHFQELVFDTIIHRNTTLTEASSHGATVIMHDAASRGTINYLNFARELLQKNNLTKIGNEEKIIELDNEQ
jgi:chromosome partitioning protein